MVNYLLKLLLLLMTMKKKKLNFLILLFTTSFFAIAQSNSDEKYYKWFDSTIGIENTGLYNGVEYIDAEQAKGEFIKFLYRGDFRNGTIDYDGQTYYDIPLKYDVFNDKLVIKIVGDNSTSILQLFTEKLSSFKTSGQSFTKIENTITENDNDKLSGFYEILFDSSEIKVYKKHRKGQLRQIKNKTLLFEYKSKDPYYFLEHENNMYSVKNKRDFIQLFPEFKKEINALGVEGSVRRNNPDAYILAFTKQLNILLSKK